MPYYKVTKTNDCGEQVSCTVSEPPLITTYPIGVQVTPKYPAFIFDSLQSALDYAETAWGEKIWRVEATGVRSAPGYIPHYTSTALQIAAFWAGNAAGWMHVPAGTMIADSITLLEEVPVKEFPEEW